MATNYLCKFILRQFFLILSSFFQMAEGVKSSPQQNISAFLLVFFFIYFIYSFQRNCCKFNIVKNSAVLSMSFFWNKTHKPKIQRAVTRKFQSSKIAHGTLKHGTYAFGTWYLQTYLKKCMISSGQAELNCFHCTGQMFPIIDCIKKITVHFVYNDN